MLRSAEREGAGANLVWGLDSGFLPDCLNDYAHLRSNHTGSSPVPGTDLTQHYRESGRAVHATLGGDEEPLVPEELADYLRTWCAASERSVSARTSSGVRPLERVRVPRVD